MAIGSAKEWPISPGGVIARRLPDFTLWVADGVVAFVAETFVRGASIWFCGRRRHSVRGC